MYPRRISTWHFIIVILIIICGFIYFYLNNVRIEKKAFATKMNGIIQVIYFTEKGEMEVEINNEVYHLPFNENTENIDVGDSLVKNKNSYEILQYRNGKEINNHYGLVTKN